MAIPHPDAPPIARVPRPATPAPKPVNYGRTGPGTHVETLGAKMRQETSQALEQLMKHASFQTGLETLLMKLGVAGPGMPQAPFHEQVAARGRRNAFEQHDPLLADVHQMAGKMYNHAPNTMGAGLPPTPMARATAAFAPGARAAGPGMLGRLGRGAALGTGIAAAGALGLGALAHRTAQGDEQARHPSLVYSPMTGVA